MTLEQGLAFGLMGVTVALFIWGKLRYDLIALTALVAGALMGVIPAEEMFAGFANDLIWIIASALLLSAAIARSGIVERALDPVLSRLKRPYLLIPAFSGGVMLLSMVTKNIGALAIFMPLALQQARRAELSPSRLLMPMAFASLLGGLVTLVGTSPNVIVSGVRESLTGEPFQMFDFSPVGLGICAVGIVFLSIAPHFIRIERKPAASVDAAFAGARYVTELSVAEGSSCSGKTVADLEESAKGEAKVLALLSDAGRRAAKADDMLSDGDRLIVEGDQEALERFAAAANLKLVGERHRDEEETPADVRVLEGVIRGESALVGRSVAQLRLYERFGMSLLAVNREGRKVSQELRSLKLRAGDVAVFKIAEEHAGDALAELHILPLSERPLALGAKRFGYAPIIALATAMLLVAFGVLPIALAFTAAAVAVLLLRVMSMQEAYRAIDGSLLVLLAALIPLSESIERTGGDQLIAGFLSQALGPMPPFLAIATLIVAAMAVTPFLNNAATVLIMAPIAAAIANTLEVNPDAYLMAVAIGAACDFLTPIGHQCNTLVMGPGGYRFQDYWKLGLPLSVIVVVVATPLILMFWPSGPH